MSLILFVILSVYSQAEKSQGHLVITIIINRKDLSGKHSFRNMRKSQMGLNVCNDGRLSGDKVGPTEVPLLAFIRQHKSMRLAEKRCHLPFLSPVKSSGHMYCLEAFQLNSTDLSVKMRD